jgi:hypothetical protein
MPESLDAQISFDAGTSFESIQVTPLGSDNYRLEATPIFFEDVSFGDTIEATKDGEGRLLFHKLITRGKFQSYRWILTKQVIELPEFVAFCNNVMRLGGMWEQLLGGLVFIHLPQDCDLNAESLIEDMIKTLDSRFST